MGRQALLLGAILVASGGLGTTAQSIFEQAMDLLKELEVVSKPPVYDFSFVMDFKDGCLTPTDDTCAQRTLAALEPYDCSEPKLFPYLNTAAVTCKGTSSAQLLGLLRSNENVTIVSPNTILRPIIPLQTNDTKSEDTLSVATLSLFQKPGSDASSTVGVGGGGGSLYSLGSSFDRSPSQVYSWGRDRIDALKGTDGNVDTCPTGGAGVVIYTLDTGCRTDHQEFGGRARSTPVQGQSVILDGIDTFGHGTHTAGTAAGKNIGIAWAAEIRCIKTLGDNGSGLTDWTIAALNEIVQDVQEEGLKKVVVNMSLGGTKSQNLNSQIEKLNSMGIICVVAAGNSRTDAYNSSPASAMGAITVGATKDVNDGRDSAYSNYGWVVDIYAPGTTITSSYNDGNQKYAILRGTSMAAPHVAGAVACIMGNSNTLRFCRTSTDYMRKLVPPFPKAPVYVPQYPVSKPLVFMDPLKPPTCDTF